VSDQTVDLGHFTAREKAGIGGWVGTGACLDILVNRYFCCSCQDLNLRSSILTPVHFADYAASY
jgi:hypothetical protein